MRLQLRFLVVVMVLASTLSCRDPSQTTCDPAPAGTVQPDSACTAALDGTVLCTAAMSRTSFSCSASAGCWAAGQDNACAAPQPLSGSDGGVKCPSGEGWNGRTCDDENLKRCFGRTLAQCAKGCWYPIRLCLEDGGYP